MAHNISTPIYRRLQYVIEVIKMEKMNNCGCGCGSGRHGMRGHHYEGTVSEELEDYKDQLEAEITLLEKRLERIKAAQKESSGKE